MATTVKITFDCADPQRLAAFWAAALGYREPDPPAGYDTWQDWLAERGVPEERRNTVSAIVDPDGRGPRLFFQRVPEAKVAKNRVHLDVYAGGDRGTPPEERHRRVDGEIPRLEGFGATVLRTVEEQGEYWVVLQDPEGNEFCVM